VLFLLLVDLVEAGSSCGASDLSRLRSIFASPTEGRDSISLYRKVGS
jgi:hypothetical protein